MAALLTTLLVLAVVLAISATTPTGRRLAVGLGLRRFVAGAASSQDIAFLLGRCGHDRSELERRLAAERERFPALTEAEHCRRAIRRILHEQAGG